MAYPQNTERRIQNLIYYEFYKSLLLIPNVKLFAWESDVLGISKKGEITEFEIKLTREDFLRDFEKSKHKQFLNPPKTRRMPSRFYFVCPSEVIRLEEVPDYAGLIWVDSFLYPTNGGGRAWEKKRAPIISKYRIDPRHLRRALVSVTSRFWVLRGEKTFWNQ